MVGCVLDNPMVNGSSPRRPIPRIGYHQSKTPYGQQLHLTDGDSDEELKSRSSDEKRSTRVSWVDSPWPSMAESRVKRVEMKPPSFDGRGSVRTFLAKFENCALHNRWAEGEQLHYFTNCLEDPTAQILWDLRSGGSCTFHDLRRTLEVVYGSVGQAEVYRSQLKIRRRRKGESLTDLAQDIRKLMVLAYP